tara:strand:+ start:472 stop:690 length:219 start_codon:yes stop_codon:yes gene_type:complete
VSETVNETEKKWVDPADFFPTRRKGIPRVKSPIFGEWNFAKQVEMQERMRERRLRLIKNRNERKKNAANENI